MTRMAVVTMVAVAAMLVTVGWLRGGDDAVLDAKRKVGVQLFSAKKYEEAVSVLTEVVKQDPQQYRDHLLLARSFEKLGKGAECVESYRKVMELLPESPTAADERSARTEADKAIKRLDAFAGKVDIAVEDFLKRLDQLRKEAESANNQAGLDRLRKLKAAVQKADGQKGKGGIAEVSATSDWQDSGLTVTAGTRYHVLAQGTWRLASSDARTECTANGLKELGGNANGPSGALIGCVGKTPPIVTLGSDMFFVAPANGRLFLKINDESLRDNSGTIQVVIEN